MTSIQKTLTGESSGEMRKHKTDTMSLDVSQLERLKFSDEKQVIINNKFLCRFLRAKDQKTDEAFSLEEKDVNSPRVSRKAYVEVYEYEKFLKRAGMLIIAHDPDLSSSSHSVSICLGELKPKKVSYDTISELDSKHTWHSSMLATSADVVPARFSFKEFMKLIHYKPKYRVKEPQDSLGLSIAQFEGLNEQEGSIEFSADGFIYYEAINLQGYDEGEIMGDSIKYDVISNTFLTKENAESIAAKINRSLDKIFNGKAIR